MQHDVLTYKDYAEWASQSIDRISRDCEATAFHASGHGGQCVNTTDSAVRMVHVPSGIVVVSRESRSQYRNRQICLQKLRKEFQQRSRPPEKRVKTKVPARARQKRLRDKRFVARKKALRKPTMDD